MKDLKELLDEKRRKHYKYAELNLWWNDTLAHMIGFSILPICILALTNFFHPASQRIVNIIILVFSTLALVGQVISLSMRFNERFHFHRLQEGRYSSLIVKLAQNLLKEEDVIREYENIMRDDADLLQH